MWYVSDFIVTFIWSIFIFIFIFICYPPLLSPFLRVCVTNLELCKKQTSMRVCVANLGCPCMPLMATRWGVHVCMCACVWMYLYVYVFGAVFKICALERQDLGQLVQG